MHYSPDYSLRLLSELQVSNCRNNSLRPLHEIYINCIISNIKVIMVYITYLKQTNKFSLKKKTLIQIYFTYHYLQLSLFLRKIRMLESPTMKMNLQLKHCSNSEAPVRKLPQHKNIKLQLNNCSNKQYLAPTK